MSSVFIGVRKPIKSTKLDHALCISWHLWNSFARREELSEWRKRRGEARGVSGMVMMATLDEEGCSDVDDYTNADTGPATPEVYVTVITNMKGLATKVFKLDGDGYSKESAAQIYEGTFHRIKVHGIRGLLTAINALMSNQALVYGVPKTDRETGKVTTQKAKKLNGHSDAIARDREHFTFPEGEPGVLMLDYDPRKGHTPLSREKLDDILCEVIPKSAPWNARGGPRHHRSSIANPTKGS